MRSFESETRQRIEAALKQADTTKFIDIGYSALDRIAESFNQNFPGQTAVVIADKNTVKAAGFRAHEVLKASLPHILPPYVFEEEDLHAESVYVDRLTEFLSSTDAVAIAVGSGTINDLTKLASHKVGRQYMTVVTAGSVDGYTAFGASITHKGFKQTMNCPAPQCVIADLGVLAEAPPEMNAWGYADLIAKIPAGADWIIADALGIESINPVSWELVQNPLRQLTSDPSGVKACDGKALCFLIEGLIMSGLAMQNSGSSRPASGAEHQFSHLWDMQNHTHNGVTPSHGFKVAIGSLSSLALYDQVLRLPISSMEWNEDEISCRWPSTETIENRIKEIFPAPELNSQAIKQCLAKYVDVHSLSKRLAQLSSIWPELKPALEKQIMSFDELREKLSDVGGPLEPVDIGIKYHRLRESYSIAQLIRSRYTILDVALEGGWMEPLVSRIFEKPGYWKNT